ncbi:MAG: TIGR02996 domain-containing protein [Gemmataceae bacterium]
MSDHDALLAAVLADPDSDLPRLVFADHLDESGHPADAARAQFIRLQIEAARLLESARDDAITLHRAARALEGHCRDEVDLVMPPEEYGAYMVMRRRGFAHQLWTGSNDLERLGSQLFAVAPIRSVTLTSFLGSNDWLEHADYLGRVEELSIAPVPLQRPTYPGNGPPQEHDADYRPLVETAHLTCLQQLYLIQNRLDNNWLVWFARAFTRTSFANSLRVLDLSGNYLTDAGASVLVAASGFDRLNQVVLAGTYFTPHGVGLLRRRFGERVRF